jgi:hypothetical protein
VICHFEAEPQEIIPPKVWFQLRAAFGHLAANYGIGLQVRFIEHSKDLADQKFLMWAFPDEGKPGG